MTFIQAFPMGSIFSLLLTILALINYAEASPAPPSIAYKRNDLSSANRDVYMMSESAFNAYMPTSSYEFNTTSLHSAIPASQPFPISARVDTPCTAGCYVTAKFFQNQDCTSLSHFYAFGDANTCYSDPSNDRCVILVQADNCSNSGGHTELWVYAGGQCQGGSTRIYRKDINCPRPFSLGVLSFKLYCGSNDPIYPTVCD
jgi:hypothetical protein